MNEDTQPDHLENARKEQGGPGEGTGELFPRPRPELSRQEKADDQRLSPQPSVYLWLCCEGWMKFGPYAWLRFDDEKQAILGPEGEEVAKKADGRWRVPGEKWMNWSFSDPTITTTPMHPHRNSGSHPGARG